MPKIGEVKPLLASSNMRPDSLDPFWQTKGGMVRLYHGDVVDVLSRMPSQSVQMIVTSPPYFQLRDYRVKGQLGAEKLHDCLGWAGARDPCGECFVCHLVQVFRECKRVLRDDGTLWLNLGDSYANTGGGGEPRMKELHGKSNNRIQSSEGATKNESKRCGLKAGNLIGIPWRVALALQADEWNLRQDIIWVKPSAICEPVKNRCTKSHEYLFILTKSMNYYYDHEAIKVQSDLTRAGKIERTFSTSNPEISLRRDTGRSVVRPKMANKRSVWTVANSGYPGAHFSVFPPKLIEPCILAGSSEKGCCSKCNSPWRRVVSERKLTRPRPNDFVKRTGEQGTGNKCANTVAGVETTTLGWQPTCQCNGILTALSVHEIIEENGSVRVKVKKEIEYTSSIPLDKHPITPCIVLDTFIGSGTTCEVSLLNGRASIGIDLSDKYLLENAIPRIRKAILSKPSLITLLPEEV